MVSNNVKKKRPSLKNSDPPNKKLKSNDSSIISISRSISLCKRCRRKKVKCSPNFPACENCEKAGVECIGIDPISGREAPRNYVDHLEKKIQALERKLKQNGINLDENNTNGAEFEKPLPIELNETPILRSSTLVKDSNISFAKLMFTALKFNNKKNLSNPSLSSNNDDEKILPAILPPKFTAQEFIKNFFSQSNSQLPILNREEFILNVFNPIYGELDDSVSLASDFIDIHRTCSVNEEDTWFYQYKSIISEKLSNLDFPNDNIKNLQIMDISNSIIPPERFHKPLYFLNIVFAISSSVHHLQYLKTISESFRIAANKYIDSIQMSDPLEYLQSLLLISLYSTMRPANPGVWYVLGTALRLCVDIGLHQNSSNNQLDPFIKDKRNRLFWCTYSLDRQICFYLDRPFGIPDESIDVPFPTEADDSFILSNSQLKSDFTPSYKVISLNMFKIRQIQSEIQKILYENNELPRVFRNLNDWKNYINNKLQIWKSNLPKTPKELNCNFNLEFFNLNYNHSLLKLYGLSPKNYELSLKDFEIIGEASKMLIKCYYQLYLSKSINYTWAAFHNLFMGGTSYLFAIYNCEQFRLKNNLHEVKQITSNCLTILNSLIDRCDAAFKNLDFFEMLTMVILKLKYNETVHGLNNRLDVNSIKINSTNINSNLIKLLEDLNDDYTNLDDTLNDKSPSTFEWITNPISSFSKVEIDEDPLIAQNHDLDLFFLELNNVSPSSSAISKSDSISDYRNENNIILKSQNSMNSSPSVMFNSNDNILDFKEGKKVFKILHEIPNEAIWDQFFTNPNLNSLNAANTDPNRLFNEADQNEN
ncbi:hypothetical protein HYPBUDRAFT_148254 [Hyphopichia burtonii NRRL Y-1933]|uniref:Zn(2)-C6 fungal-type domain-containing protein n=1 Tax=Hyphopichia burtonii NRRL Y-1933 TaxID=984485 RepID=A0A1E4RL10_9ASCO|nr:hypothetical protein HYPBUDRAFT_148254 [Hyphopichia burtonii NRRL Y-1933]ODV67959.1 hypothetical protein HYPBUDRAFT_148254 [Hyphopichia burtonii NRRL Y-1933]